MITYLMVKEAKNDFEELEDYGIVALIFVLCLFTLLLDIALIFMQPLFVAFYLIITSKRR